MEQSNDDHNISNEIKRTKKNVFRFLLLIGFLFIGLICYGIFWAFFDMNRLPAGELIEQSHSPNGKYTINTYVSNGGATTNFAIRAELVSNKSSKKKNIYWNYREENANIVWVDDDTVNINGHVLRLPNEKFDFRRE
ncbi:DUF5412 domain-containing protein [Paenibacillus qinlingensis]|uniref:DUF5412 domain-containing protein n=1 Tax=Paenibacillus qinlingensis TaxID=1837343 RepID=UPI00156365B2|nr:DUF5412 domain-containing protein [Paenibacillus qinlingensis]NQX57975.1 DUF5412 domain-containing protein [Paenibacillus qinlingensis]